MSKNNIHSKPRGLAQQGSRSMTLGQNDPRHRRAAQELGTGYWFQPPFDVDDRGVMQLALEGPLTLTDDGKALTIRVEPPLYIEHGSPKRIVYRGTDRDQTALLAMIATLTARLDSDEIRLGTRVGELLISDTASNPPVYADILVNDDGTDFLYAD